MKNKSQKHRFTTLFQTAFNIKSDWYFLKYAKTKCLLKKIVFVKFSDFYDIHKKLSFFFNLKWKIIQKYIFDEFHQTNLYLALFFKAMTLVSITMTISDRENYFLSG